MTTRHFVEDDDTRLDARAKEQLDQARLMQMYQLVPSKDAEAGLKNGKYKSKWAHNDGDEKLDDLVHMTFLEYPNILHTLRERTKTTPYTRIGPRSVLISVNPYKRFKGMYDEEKIDEYHAAQHHAQLCLSHHQLANYHQVFYY